MTYKWFGAALVILGCGGFGFQMAAAHKREEQTLRRVVSALDLMECDLQYHLTPLPELCRRAGTESKGAVRQVLCSLSDELKSQASPDVEGCMTAVLAKSELRGRGKEMLAMLGHSLGRFDLQGQIKGLESVRTACRRELDELASNRDVRLRSYQTLGLCAGSALAILFI